MHGTRTGRVSRAWILFAVAISLAGPAPAEAGTGVHLAYHWHLHQPIYWPESHPTLPRYQFAAESLDIKNTGGNTYPGSTHAHPRNNLAGGDGEFDPVFSKPDRVNAYQSGGWNAIQSIMGHPDAGASISYSGSLMENIWSWGKDNRLGYGPHWNSGFTAARTNFVAGGGSRGDMLGMTYHHAFSPLLPRSVLRKEIQIFKEIWWRTWSGASDKSDHSKGFWPIECAFSRHMIPVLVDEGYEWVIVANSHLARTCGNYLDVARKGNSGWNIDPPNRADRIGPTVPSDQWYTGTIDGRGGAFPAPFAYQPHKAKYVDPETGAETRMTVVPMCDYLSYVNGFSSMGTGEIDAELAPFNDTARPSLVLMAHDGDNAWGGGSSYYQESVPDLMDEASGKGYRPSTIQKYLNEHPVPSTDVVHVEDGAWVNAANDWGHPQFINWLWPPARDPAHPDYDADDPRTWFDIETGWTEDWRNWAVVIAAANHCETAEQIASDNGRTVNAWKIQEPSQPNGTGNSPNNAERAWHHFLAGLDSGFMYYGTSLDDEVKQTLAGNIAVNFANAAMADNPGSHPDRTPPTLFKPQRYPWNPGGMGWGPLTGYRAIGFEGNDPHYSDFYIWTHVYDISGVTGVTLYVRADADGDNPLADNANETYAGGTGVGAWQQVAMTRRTIGPTEGGNGDTLNFFLSPQQIADHYWAKVTGYSETLLDYYVEAVDSLGNTSKSDIQHVYVGQAHGGGPTNKRVCLVEGSPLITDNPAAQNTSVDAFDLDQAGGSAATIGLGGFGNFGQLHLNADATNLYLGAYDCDVAGNNNVMVLFIGMNTLTADVTHIRAQAGLPHALDRMHNLDFTDPVDLALVLGDEYGDGTFVNFNLGNGDDLGQGVFHIGTTSFVEVAGARVSQYDGDGTLPTGSDDADNDRLTDRWEACIPWSELHAVNAGDLVHLTVAGVFASNGTAGDDRYLSGNIVGAGMTSSGMDGNNVGLNNMSLQPLAICLDAIDTDDDLLPDYFERTHFGDLTEETATGNGDGDVFNHQEEYWLGTDPTNGASALVITAEEPAGSMTRVSWRSVGGKTYAVESSDDLAAGFVHLDTVAETNLPAGVAGETEIRDARPQAPNRTYRIRLAAP